MGYEVYTDMDSTRDGYPQFEASIQKHFDKGIQGGKPLFRTNVENLYDIYLENLPEYARQHYTCNACRSFINRYGNLVTIDEDGIARSVIWDEAAVPDFFVDAVIKMRHAVLTAPVVSQFIPEEKKLGLSKTGEWTHLHVELPRDMMHRNVLLNAGQKMAERREDFRILSDSVQDFKLDVVNKAITLIESDTVYRADNIKAWANWFKNLLVQIDDTFSAGRKRNLLWYAVATAPTGYTHVRSGNLGAFLKDVKEGLSARAIAAKFQERMGTYRRSQNAPSANAIVEAEKVVEKLGIANSLSRRYATLEEVPAIWQPKAVTPVAEKQGTTGVFGHLTPKDHEAPTAGMDIPAKLMTWEKFERTVMPGAESIEVLNDNPGRFMALVTAADEKAPNILQWDNKFSWYYHGGVDGEIKRRVQEAGGRYEDNEIRASLIWEGLTDLDLHCITPQGYHIYYNTGSRKDAFGGYLDLDMNGMDRQSSKPVENMRWAKNAPEGRYKFYVHNYRERTNPNKGTPFAVELEIGGKVYRYDGAPLRWSDQVVVFEFEYKKGQAPRFLSGAAASSNASWGVEENKFVKVNAITTSPNLWGETPHPQSGTHIFFLLDGVKDEEEGKGRGFFNEMLKSELHPIRRTLEAYTGSTPIEGVENATACGVGYSKDSEWNVTLRVKSQGSTRLIKIDRWD